MQMNQQSLVSITNVSFHYGTEPTIANINLEVARGEFLGILGPNGGGKTTLLKILLGLLKPDTGTVKLFGKDIREFRDWSKIGYVPQKAGSNVTPFPITVEEVVSMGRLNSKRFIDFSSAADAAAITEALTAVEIEKFRHHLLNELSGGQQQRVFIARALASHPELLILDEPTVGVDVEAQTKFYQLLQNLNKKQNLTLLLVSHDMEVVAHEASNVACINGTLIYHGKPKEVLKSDFIEKLYGKELQFVVHGH